MEIFVHKTFNIFYYLFNNFKYLFNMIKIHLVNIYIEVDFKTSNYTRDPFYTNTSLVQQ